MASRTGASAADAILALAPLVDTNKRVIYSSPTSVSADFKVACTAQKQIPLTLVQTLDANMVPTADITSEVDDGSVTVDVSRLTRRTAQLRLVNDDGRFTPNDVTDPFFWNNMFRVYRGLRYIDSLGRETSEYVCLGTFLVDRPEVFVEKNMSVITVDGSDRFKQIATGGFGSDMTFPPGTLVSTVIQAVLFDSGIPLRQTSIDCLLGRFETAPGSSLIPDPSFETSIGSSWANGLASPVIKQYGVTTDWVMYPGNPNASVARVNASGMQTSDGGNWCVSVNGNGAGFSFPNTTFIAGVKYTFSAYFRSSPNAVIPPIVAVIVHSAEDSTDNAFEYFSIMNPLVLTPEQEVSMGDMSQWTQPWMFMKVDWTPTQERVGAVVQFCQEAGSFDWAGSYDANSGTFFPGGTLNMSARPFLMDNVYFGGSAYKSARRVNTSLHWSVGDNRSDFLQNLYDQFALEGYFDVYGIYHVIDSKNPAYDTPVWTFAPGPEAVMLGVTRTQDDLTLVNKVVVKNSDSTTNVTDQIIWTKSITDPLSPYHSSRIGNRVLVYSAPLVTLMEQGIAVLDKLFRENCAIAEQIKLPTVCLPFLDGGDAIQITEPLSGLSDKYQCKRFTVPLRESRMTIESTRAEPVS